MKYKQKNAGFTLVELLVVISIIGILSTLAVVSLNNARLKARDAKRVSDIKQIQTALELYASDQNGYPDATDLTLGSGAGSTISKDGGIAAVVSGTTYMGKVPANALPGGADYKYSSYTNSSETVACTSAPCIWDNISFTIEEQVGDLPAGAHNMTPNGIY